MQYSLVKIGNSPNWFVQWFERGHSRRVSTRTPSRKAAEAFRRAFELERETHPTAGHMLPAILDWYITTRGPEIKTLSDAERAARNLKDYFGDVPPERLSIASQTAYAKFRGETVGVETVRRELSVLSAALHLAEKHDRIAKSPAILALPKSPPRDRYVTRDEVAMLLRHMRKPVQIDPERKRKTPSAKPKKKVKVKDKVHSVQARHLTLFTRLALYTGARSGAILDLTWDRVDLERGYIWYPLPGVQTSNKQRAIVPIGANVVRMLERAKRRAPEPCGKARVLTWRGEPIGRVSRGFTRHAKAVGLDGVTPHTLRHSFATWAAQKGVPLFQIGGVLGQSIQSTTERYAKHNREAFRVVTEAVRRK